ncbi:MAG: UDP-2,4-diacetamido-2,4,6-trideoxy-beta-L-altropyranose hydrolase [Dehalococcoidia bacterium]
MTHRLVVRADAGEWIGTGHVMRGIAIGQAWADAGGEVVFALAGGGAAIEARIREEGFSLVRLDAAPGSAADAAETVAVGARWIAVDGYHFNADYFDALRGTARLLVVDDWGHAGRSDADLLLNGNAYASADLYHDSMARLLIGTRYVPLRREFMRGWLPRNTPPAARTVLVTLGGADPDNRTRTIVEALSSLTLDFEARVVVGASNPHAEAVRAAAARDRRIAVLGAVSDMPALMNWADLAIAGAGTTTWELCALGVPSLLAVLADNQAPVAQSVAERGAALSLGRLDDVLPDRIAGRIDMLMRSPELRFLLSEQGRALVDGHGAARVVREMLAREVTLRQAGPDDQALVYAINNHPAVRRWSFSTGSIAWEDHVRWFAGKLADPRCLLYIAEDECEPVGLLRLELRGDEATVSVGVDPGWHGRGYGTAILRAGLAAVVGRAATLRAVIKPENAASIRAFTSAGYRPDEDTTVDGERALVMRARPAA